MANHAQYRSRRWLSLYSSSLPKVEIQILGTGQAGGGTTPDLLSTAPAPLSSSEPFDIIPQ